MKFFGKRFWASALSALMLSSVMPVQAFALDDATSAASSVAAESVASSEKAGSVQPESGVMGNDVVSSSGMVSSETQVVLAGIGLDQTQVTVRQGERFQLTITYTPENVPGTGAPVWSSSAPDVASVDESGTVSGKWCLDCVQRISSGDDRSGWRDGNCRGVFERQ